MLGEESYRAWGELLYTVKTGKPAFDQVYNMRRFEYLDQNPCSLAPYRCRVAADEPRWRQPDVGLWSLYRGLEWARLLGATPPMRMTYMRLLESRVFFDQHFFLLSVSRGSRERKFALMARQLSCLAALSGQTPGARRVAPEGARG